MITLLHVAVSPLNKGSYSAQVGAAFVDAWKASYPDGVVDTFHLWSDPLPAFDAVGASWKIKAMAGQAGDATEQALFDRVKVVADRFLAADQYLFSVPMWNFHIPYPLKHFFDVIVQPGLTFALDATGSVGLVPDRPVQLVLSRGSLGYGPGGAFDGWDHQEPYLRGILKFIGLTDVRCIVVEGTAYGPQVADPALEYGLAQAAEAASKFARTSTPDRTTASVT